jgi:hypothetical protein
MRAALGVGFAVCATSFVVAATVACSNGDVGGRADSGSAGASAQAAGGAAGIDTAGTKVNTERSGSAVAPGPGRIPGTPGALTGDSAGGGRGAKTKARRP